MDESFSSQIFFPGDAQQVSVAEWLARLTAVWEDPGLNHAADSCVYRDSCCDIQSWARAVHLYCLGRLSLPPFVGRWNEYQLTGWVIITMAMVDDSWQFSADSQPKSIGSVWGLAATRRSVYIHQVNRVNYRDDFGRDDSTINIVTATLAR